MKKYILVVLVLLLISCQTNKEVKMIDLSNMSLNDIKDYAKANNLNLELKEEYNEDISKDKIISQSIEKDKIINNNDKLVVIISLGKIPVSLYKDNKVNELGYVPIMMYHGIINKTNDETSYTKGNVDKQGYNRTKEAFVNDLEMYYKNNYRMIRLKDYMDGNINIPLGKSPIVLTFDDGNKNNFNVIDIKDDKLVIDPDCAVGILESFKKKYPDYNVTATFFLNNGLFGQSKYNEKILKWLIDNGYDIGNHSKNHVNFNEVDNIKTQSEIASMYQVFDNIIPNKYLHVIALPFGSPDKKSHVNFSYILEGKIDDYSYKTEGTLRVGWEPNESPFHKKFDKTFMKRVRAWDNNGSDFDIEMVFNNLNNNKYISDGDSNTIVISNDIYLNENIFNKKIIRY